MGTTSVSQWKEATLIRVNVQEELLAMQSLRTYLSV
jgi:hypothetical protein